MRRVLKKSGQLGKTNRDAVALRVRRPFNIRNFENVIPNNQSNFSARWILLRLRVPSDLTASCVTAFFGSVLASCEYGTESEARSYPFGALAPAQSVAARAA